MLHTSLNKAKFVTASLLLLQNASAATWEEKGNYPFSQWAGPSLGVFYSVPPEAGPDTPILVVVPGARRNAAEYRDAWHELALANRFITLTIEAAESDFPTEYHYNAGGVVESDGKPVSEPHWTYSAIEPLFDDFKRRFGSQRERYSIYGHSAGGQFVLGYLLFKPDARVERAVAANPAFCFLLDSEEPYPFGLRSVQLPERAFEKWFMVPTVLLLGDRDLAPRTRPLSNGPIARAQGPHVFARGLAFYRAALTLASERQIELQWRLEVVPGVGHSNQHMASHAVKNLFAD